MVTAPRLAHAYHSRQHAWSPSSPKPHHQTIHVYTHHISQSFILWVTMHMPMTVTVIMTVTVELVAAAAYSQHIAEAFVCAVKAQSGVSGQAGSR